MQPPPKSLLAPKQAVPRRPNFSDLFNSPLLPKNSSFKSRGPAASLSVSLLASTAPLTPPYTPSPQSLTPTSCDVDPPRLIVGNGAAKDWAAAAPLTFPFSPSSFPTSQAPPLFPNPTQFNLHERSSSSPESSSMAKKKIKAKGTAAASYAAAKAHAAAAANKAPNSEGPNLPDHPPPHEVRDAYFVPPPSANATGTTAEASRSTEEHHGAYGHKARARSLSPGMQRRGRSTRPRLLWRSTVDANVLRVLDGHHLKAYGSKVPRLRGPGSEEGRLWSEELDRSGL